MPSPATPAIQVRDLSKQYRLGSFQGYTTLAETLTGLLRRRERPAAAETLWALKDVSFDVAHGEVVGFIGHNGAGKSTLLKILSRITEPTSGHALIDGRVASLLEVGTGFHTELTGRENIYLNGSILGMRKAEIDRSLEAIIDFAGIEAFLDTPVKRYSSGMQVRLAFAVAAHLRQEILIVDEVLAVGDAEFQRKCLGKMSEVSASGRTVLFVSHNMGAISGLCSRVYWLDHGQIADSGPPLQVIQAYLQRTNKGLVGDGFTVREDLSKPFQLLSASVRDSHGETPTTFSCDDAVTVEFEAVARQVVPGLYGYLRIEAADGTVVLVSDSYDAGPNALETLAPGRHRFKVEVPARTLAPGDYYAFLSFASPRNLAGHIVDQPGNVAHFRLEDYTTRRGNQRDGYFSVKLPWTLVGAASGTQAGSASPGRRTVRG
jgi:lipopolysaccharide transport system ATP-binding protein